MAYSFQVVEEKLQEADYFLCLLQCTKPLSFESRCYFSAFVSASRSVTFALQFSIHGIPNFERWYTKAQERLRADALAPHFKEMRNDMQKKGVNPLNQVPVEHLKEHLARQLTESTYGHVMVIPHPTQKGNTVLVDAVNACSDYFNSLVSLIYDAYSEFKYDVDPQWYYTRESFEAKGRSFLDAVVELGFPPEWANAAPNEDEGWHVLRLQQPPCALNSMFYAYLGKIIEPPTQLV